jgi:hypothetical protein
VSAERLCQGCGRPLPVTSRADRFHHNVRCRKLAARRRLRDRPAAPLLPEAGVAPDLRAALEAATAEHRLLAYVAREAQSNWRAAAWLLERRWPGRWASAPRLDVEPPPPAPGPDDPFREVDQLAERRRRRGQPDPAT